VQMRLVANILYSVMHMKIMIVQTWGIRMREF
jgi:hypothetical protein